jgi:dinuclear metal center YbgI/SA1388 family protein
MRQIRDLTAFLESLAPLHYQESYDNSGLIVGRPDQEITGVLTTLDCTEAVLDEAESLGCNVVVAHHPIVFKGLKRFNEANYVERVVAQAIRKGIAIYAIHTNLDNMYQGVNARFAERLGLIETRILTPKSSNDLTIGSGMIGRLAAPIDWSDFLDLLHVQMGAQVVRHTEPMAAQVETIAVCGGSGSFLLPAAIAAGAHCYVTADFKYHEFFDADGQITICDIGHFESEQFTSDLLAERISEKTPTFAVRKSKVRTNPVHYAYSSQPF